MAGGEQPAPGHRDDLAVETAPAQADGEVDHRQAGTHDQHRAGGIEGAPGFRVPRVAADTVVVHLDGRQVADGDDDTRHLDTLTAAADENETVQIAGCFARLDVDDLVGQQTKPCIAGGLPHRFVQDGPQIFAVEPPGGEKTHFRLVHAFDRMPRPRPLAGQPIVEMAALVGEGAHIGGAHVQQVLVLPRRIRDATGKLRRALA